MWAALAQLLGGSPLEAIKDLVQTFKLPPEQQLQFEQSMKKMETDVELGMARIDADDRASARLREVNAGDTRHVFYLAVAITAGFFGVLAYMLNYPVPPQAERVIDIMLGTLGTAWVAVISYYFGSSSGSQRKDKTIDRLAGVK